MGPLGVANSTDNFCDVCMHIPYVQAHHNYGFIFYLSIVACFIQLCARCDADAAVSLFYLLVMSRSCRQVEPALEYQVIEGTFRNERDQDE